MKTWQAALAHIGIAGLQAAAAAPFFDQGHTSGVMGNLAVQLVAQGVLSSLQAAVAAKNSNTDPNGNKLEQSAPGVFKSVIPIVTK